MALDPEIQRRLALKSFFENPGYKIFKEELEALYEAYKPSRALNPVEFTELGKHNFLMGEKSGLEKVLFILEELHDEMKPEDNSLDQA